MNLQEYTDILEQFMDSHGLDVVVATLGIICDDKAAHAAAVQTVSKYLN